MTFLISYTCIILYFAWARSKVKVCFFHISWRHAVFARFPENIANLGKYSTLGLFYTMITYGTSLTVTMTLSDYVTMATGVQMTITTSLFCPVLGISG